MADFPTALPRPNGLQYVFKSPVTKKQMQRGKQRSSGHRSTIPRVSLTWRVTPAEYATLDAFMKNNLGQWFNMELHDGVSYVTESLRLYGDKQFKDGDHVIDVGYDFEVQKTIPSKATVTSYLGL